MLAISYLVLQACVSFCITSDKCGACLFVPCSHKNDVVHVQRKKDQTFKNIELYF